MEHLRSIAILSVSSLGNEIKQDVELQPPQMCKTQVSLCRTWQNLQFLQSYKPNISKAVEIPLVAASSPPVAGISNHVESGGGRRDVSLTRHVAHRFTCQYERKRIICRSIVARLLYDPGLTYRATLQGCTGQDSASEQLLSLVLFGGVLHFMFNYSVIVNELRNLSTPTKCYFEIDERDSKRTRMTRRVETRNTNATKSERERQLVLFISRPYTTQEIMARKCAKNGRPQIPKDASKLPTARTKDNWQTSSEVDRWLSLSRNRLQGLILEADDDDDDDDDLFFVSWCLDCFIKHVK
ncbi:hypothetical protein ANN_03031 [Periplaneta americana]|uniref:Uncharacterized protein n=1 Tax=Periplaneta americana TaxID=6978 RepID=A0ABQ8U143_PERAM|nr:hypothetical protein ANN_03031 [Periplaneta americana]